MKKGQTLIASDGLEVCLYPMESIRITQTHYGTTSHASYKVKNTGLFDVTGCDGDAYKGVIFAPFSCKVVAIKTGKVNGNTVLVQSLNKVHLANGEIDYARFGFGHDNVVDVKIGQEIKQGEKLGDVGNYGNVTGIHSHFMCGVGEWTKGDTIPTTTNKNGNTIFYMPNAIDLDDMFYINGINEIAKVINKSKSATKSYDTVIENNDGTITQVTYCDATTNNKNFKVTFTWKKFEGQSLDLTKFQVERDEFKHQVEVKKETIRARKEPYISDLTYLGVKVPVGIYNILETTADTQYKWVRIADGVWFALAGTEGTTYQEHEPDTTDYKEKYNELLSKYQALKVKETTLNKTIDELNKKVAERDEKLQQIKEILG